MSTVCPKTVKGSFIYCLLKTCTDLRLLCSYSVIFIKLVSVLWELQLYKFQVFYSQNSKSNDILKFMQFRSIFALKNCLWKMCPNKKLFLVLLNVMKFQVTIFNQYLVYQKEQEMYFQIMFVKIYKYLFTKIRWFCI